MCSGHKVKNEQGETPDCDTECDPMTSEPNAEHTECGNILTLLIQVCFLQVQ